jgi:transposase
MSLREAKGQQIVKQHANIKRAGDLWLVPSQSGRGSYKVDPKAKTCTCRDFEFRQQSCKHIFAAEFLERTQTTTTTTDKRGKTTTTTTETVKVTRQTYRQEWPAYNKAQTQEKRLFQYLLHQLCQGIGSPSQTGAGRRFLPLEDVIFAMAFKVYSTVSGRRFMCDLKDAHGKGYLSQLPSYNSMFDHFNSEMLTPYLQMLIEESSLPLAAIEQDFAVDSSGLSSCRFVQWTQAKYTDPQLMEKREWIKVHLMCGVKTNVVTSVEITDRYASDSPRFKSLVEATGKNFYMQQVSADKAYLSNANMQVVFDHHAMPFIPFKSNSTSTDPRSKKRHSPLWKSMYHFYSYNQERFMQSYHKRSNVETTFHMIKSKFGDSLRSKTKTAQINEALCKILCHNICCLIQSMFELNLKPKFWSQAA